MERKSSKRKIKLVEKIKFKRLGLFGKGWSKGRGWDIWGVEWVERGVGWMGCLVGWGSFVGELRSLVGDCCESVFVRSLVEMILWFGGSEGSVGLWFTLVNNVFKLQCNKCNEFVKKK